MTYLDGNGATDTLGTADGPELLKGSSTVDGWLVVTGSLENVVCAAVRVDGALLLSSRRGVVGAVGLDNVVLDERVAGPAIQRNVRVYVLRVPGTAVGHGLGSTGVSAAMSTARSNVKASGQSTHRPFPATKLLTLFHCTSYCPPGPLLYVTCP